MGAIPLKEKESPMKKQIQVTQRFDVTMLFLQKPDDVEKAVRELLAPVRGCRLVRVTPSCTSVRATLDLETDIASRWSDKDLQSTLDHGLFGLVSVQQRVHLLGVKTIAFNGLGQGIDKFLRR